MTNPRVTPQGQALGKSAARLADLGQQRLEALGLTGISTDGMRAEMCKTCACQPGSVPNGCLQTQLDFLKCAAEGRPFLCHSPRDGRLCAGWVRVRAQLAAAPLPAAVMSLLARHDYSPADPA